MNQWKKFNSRKSYYQTKAMNQINHTQKYLIYILRNPIKLKEVIVYLFIDGGALGKKKKHNEITMK